jgi:hypothetical protein
MPDKDDGPIPLIDREWNTGRGIAWAGGWIALGIALAGSFIAKAIG